MRTRLLCSLILVAACADDASTGTDARSSADAATSCTYTGLAPSEETTERDDDLGLLFYTAARGTAPNIERLTVDLYFALGATDGPHEFVFTGEDLADCHTCSLIRRNCEEGNCIDGQAFLIQEGVANFTAIGASGTAFQGTIANALFGEVEINLATLEATLVPNGETWCLDDYEFNDPIDGG